ncbi:polyketide cyclase [Pseudarthrobacter albicanus]|uniref:polyketide cyclase n=1 Tax=Pseudarthrobacter albicanus TaxID=2823873 RepID=UPI001BAC553D|nr:polyketide cyclase [Pseudarthrobacter albicanus]
MWTTEYTGTTAVSPERVWVTLRGLHTGELTYEGADAFELHGPFAAGTELTVTPVGQDAFESTIVELVENETYADETQFGDLTLRFRHALVPIGDGGTRVTHRLEISGTDADEVGPQLGPQISGDFDETMSKLFELALSRP